MLSSKVMKRKNNKFIAYLCGTPFPLSIFISKQNMHSKFDSIMSMTFQGPSVILLSLVSLRKAESPSRKFSDMFRNWINSKVCTRFTKKDRCYGRTCSHSGKSAD